MVSQQPPAGGTTITALGDDLLREILLRLPDLPCLVRAAFVSPAFLRAVRSSPAFRRSFRALHAPPLLALFLEPRMQIVPVLPSRSHPGIVTVDFFGHHSRDGYLQFSVAGSTVPNAAYSPLTQALYLCYQPDLDLDPVDFEFFTVSSSEDAQRPSRVVCLHHEGESSTAFVFSSDTMDWQISRKTTLRLPQNSRIWSRVLPARGLICWHGWTFDQIVLFDAAACRFSMMDLPTPLKMKDTSTYKLGETKDEKFCIVAIKEGTLVSWVLTAAADDENVAERWIEMHNKFSLRPIVKEFTGCSKEEEVDLVAVIHGFVYLSILYREDSNYFELFLSLCLETSEISELFKGPCQYNVQAQPYVMPWPLSLVQSKEQSETELSGGSVADDGPVGTREASYVLVAALQSLSHALMNEGDGNKEMVAPLDAFLGPTVDDEGSIIRKMTTFDAQLRNVRDYILRMRA